MKRQRLVARKMLPFLHVFRENSKILISLHYRSHLNHSGEQKTEEIWVKTLLIT